MMFRLSRHDADPLVCKGSGRTWPAKTLATLAIILAGAPAVAATAPLDPPGGETLAEARQIVKDMIGSPRGPYSRIRWFCNDGSVQAPVAYACREHGGGRQHAEYSPARGRLQALGWSVGTVFAALSFEELFDSGPRQQRLRELALERYLTDIDNGWVLRRARGYRGRVQAEDEVTAGHALLLQLLNDVPWAQDNFLLLRESVRVIPHGDDSDLARTVRRRAIELAELDPAAEPWRAEIHATPGAGIAPRLRDWLQGQDEAVRVLGAQLADELEALYGTQGRQGRIDYALGQLALVPAAEDWRVRIIDALQLPGVAKIAGLCEQLAGARDELFGVVRPARRLSLLDAMQELESEVQLAYGDITAGAPLTRAELLQVSHALVDCGHGAGLLSARERASVSATLADLDGEVIPLDAYRAAIGRLKRVPGWAMGTVRHTFAEPLVTYTALDPRAMRFSDDLLRGSPLWMLGDTLRQLSADADRLSGSVADFNGNEVATAVALNGGVARGTLRIFDTLAAVETATLTARDVVVIPETIAELSPVAGILTLGEGNALSHVQLLARNFGIPNVAIDQETADALREIEGQEVLLAVDDDSNVLLRPTSRLPAETTASQAAAAGITVPLPDLDATDILPLDAIGRHLSGQVVGPKAANLGELNRLFPGRVAPAVAIPFGVYAQHLERAGLQQRIAAAFTAHAGGEIDDATLAAELADVRRLVVALTLDDATRAEIATLMHDSFGEPGSYGVFVRSDTNVEDLPQFTGAGLNETIANVVDPDEQVAGISRVWGSVLSPRALAWRSSVLANPARIYASVLLMKSVPATKSGVLVTRNLFDRGAGGITTSTAWGVGGAVAGEAAESLVIHDDSVELIIEAKAPYQRTVPLSGGVAWRPAPAGAVLDDAEIDALRRLVAEVNERYVPVYDDDGVKRPWDIEFGFIDGELTLFQIRPLVERRSGLAAATIRRLLPTVTDEPVGDRIVDLDETPGATP